MYFKTLKKFIFRWCVGGPYQVLEWGEGGGGGGVVGGGGPEEVPEV